MIAHVSRLVSRTLRKAVNDLSGEMRVNFKTIGVQENVISSEPSDPLSFAANIK